MPHRAQNWSVIPVYVVLCALHGTVIFYDNCFIFYFKVLVFYDILYVYNIDLNLGKMTTRPGPCFGGSRPGPFTVPVCQSWPMLGTINTVN